MKKSEMWLDAIGNFGSLVRRKIENVSLRWQVHVRDLTERKRLESALAMREQAYRSLAENLPDSIVRWDVAGRYIYINAVHERILGMSATDLIGKTTGEAFPDGRFAQVEAAIAQVIATGKAMLFVRQAVPVSGETRVHDINLVPERDASGKIVSVLGIGRDMTDLYRLQDDLVARERALRALAESSPGMLGSFYARPDGSICMPYVSPNIEKLFGLRPQDVADNISALFALHHPEDAQRIDESIAESARSMTTWHEEFRVLHPTLGERWMESNTNPEPHPQGGIIWYGYVHDITERKRIEAEIITWAQDLATSQAQLRLTEAWYRSILRSAPDGLLVVDARGIIVQVNAKIEALFGYEERELVGGRVEMLLPVAQRDIHVKERTAFVASRIEDRPMAPARPLFARRKDGSEFPVEVSLSRLPDNTGRAGEVCAAIRDITERKRMEDQLAQREQEFRSLAESSPDSIIRYDLDHRILYLNDLLVRDLELASDNEVIGKRPIEVWPDGRFAVIDEAAKRMIASGTTETVELVWTRDHGITRVGQIVVVPERDVTGRIIGTLAFGRDITAIREAERKLAHFIDSLPGLAYTYRLSPEGHGCFPYVSSAIEDIYGLKPEDVKDDMAALHALGHPDDQPRIEAAIAESMLSMRPFKIESRVCRPGQPERWIDVRSVPEHQPDGSVLWYGLMLDITERKQMEQAIFASQQALRRQTQFQQSLLSGMRDAGIILVVIENGSFAYTNDHYVGCQLGYAQGELHETVNFIELIHPDDRSRIAEMHRDRLAGKPVPDSYEIGELGGDGSRREYEFHVMLVPDTEPQQTLLLTLRIDERKKMENAVRRSQEMLADAQKLAQLGSWNWDVVANRVEWSEMAFEIYTPDQRPDEPGFEDFKSSIHPDDLESVVAAVESAFEHDTPFDLDHRVVSVRKGIRTVHAQGNVFRDASGKPVRMVGTVQDITERKQTQRRAELLSRAIDMSTDSIFLVNEQYRFHYVNETACRSLGYTREELLTLGAFDIDPAMTPEAVNAKRNHAPTDQPTTFETCHRGRDGREHPVELSGTSFMEGQEKWSLVVARDITERKRHEQSLRDSRDFLLQIMDGTSDPIFVKDRAHRWVMVNEAFCNLFGQPREALMGKSDGDFLLKELSETLQKKDELVFTSGETSISDESVANAHGVSRDFQIKKTSFVSKDGQELLIGVMRDTTELNVHRKRMHQMAFYDDLTGLPNRALFNDRLHQMVTDAAWHGQQAGVMLLDLDRFKNVNDTLGHPAGDQLLREAARRLTRCVRAYDSVARLGGDEFAILLPEIRTAEDLGKIASKILEAFKEPFVLEGKEVFSSTSVGIAVFPDDSRQADDLTRLADAAMYFAKRSGRNNFRFYAKELTDSSSEKLALESELRRALERHELELYYQPKISLADGRLVGSEALLRWNNPIRGMVPPDQFIGIAEDSGLIVDIGAWVLLDACRTASAWNGLGKPLHKVAINLSARQFQTGDLLKTVRQAMAQTACQPEWIELEITESLLLDEDGEVQASLNAFQAMGISIAIDDFGTGYSALSYLARFPINTLKIDRSFIRSIMVEHYRAELVKAIISIARCLGQEVVAEGVETWEQAAFLQAHGCQMAQGYLYSKPVARTAFELLPQSYPNAQMSH